MEKWAKRELYRKTVAKELKESKAKKRQKKKEVVKEETPETTE